MSRRFFTALCFYFFICLSSLFGQPGESCSNPYIIAALPFVQTGLTTEGFPDNYDDNPCGSSYMQGNDYVFSYTPDETLNIRISLKNTGFMVGVFILDNCPDSPEVECVASASEEGGNPEIYSAELQQGITYYIIVSTRVFIPGYYNYTDFDITVNEAYHLDAAIARFERPIPRCYMTDSEQINIKVKNLGIDTLYDIQLGYRINDLPPVFETYPHPLPPNVSDFHTYTEPCDISVIDSTYRIEVFTFLSGDEDVSNDTVVFNIMPTDVISEFPYFEDFESESNGWQTERTNVAYSSSSWQLGIPSADSISTAASGINAWVTNLTGPANPGEDSYVQSPCFDFSSLVIPILEVDIWYETTEYAYAEILYTTDTYNFTDGFTWQVLGSVTSGYNWYNTPLQLGFQGWNGSSGGWRRAKLRLDGFGGIPNIIFRVNFISGGYNICEGIAFDNFSIHESPLNDIGIIGIIEPYNGCDFGVSETISVQVVNYGLGNQTDFDLSYSVNGDLPVVETFFDSLYSQDTVEFIFTTPLDMSTEQIYSLVINTLLESDQDSMNNRYSTTVIHYGLNTEYPYFKDFENDNGGWYGSEFSSWQYGAPSGTALDQAASGTHAWVTNLEGNHLLNENSFLTSPCFDFSRLDDVDLKMNIWFDLAIYSYVQFQVSTDQGNTWHLVDTDADSLWYNSGHSWNGSSGDWTEVTHRLDGLEGEPYVQFRFFLTGGIEAPGFAMDDFTLCVNPVAGFDYTADGLAVSFTDSSEFTADWQWLFGDGNSSAGQNPVHIYSQDDTVEVMLVAINGCASDTASGTIVVSGVDEKTLTKYFILYPNPVSGYLYITSPALTGNILYEFTDVSGRVLHSETWQLYGSNKVRSIDLTGFAPGLYFVRLIHQKTTTLSRVVLN
ncbi:MAG: T9SS type A sorting domain-containing protein [Bacteroidetes bacterium]|nr:T9SS type A sorting domain-containing protein [Bacteroidota bacterium]